MGNIQNFGPLKFSLDPINLGFADLKGSGKIQWDPLNFLVRATPGTYALNASAPCTYPLTVFNHSTNILETLEVCQRHRAKRHYLITYTQTLYGERQR